MGNRYEYGDFIVDGKEYKNYIAERDGDKLIYFGPNPYVNGPPFVVLEPLMEEQPNDQ